METGEIFSISELNQAVRTLIEGEIGLVWVQGEISNLARPSSGHWYFSLKDQNAQVRCAMFSNRNRHLDIEPQNGQSVLAYGLVSLYENRGDYQLIVEKIEAIGEGTLQREFEKLFKKLAAEGLFDAKFKKVIPDSPQCIGVVTSPTGAAIRDILHVLKRRAPNIPVIIYPAAVQGVMAAPQVAEAIALANQDARCDVLIVARGGGSLEDLWPFNEEIVARAIFGSRIPIVSGVGHEVDFTICDSVADMRAPTPSAAAELVSPDQTVYQDYIIECYQRLIQLMQQRIMRNKDTLEHLGKRLKHPKVYWQQLRQQLDYDELRLKQLIHNQLQIYQQKLQLAAGSLQALSPLSTLNRGYTIVFNEQKQVIHSVVQAHSKQEITIQWHDGIAKAEIK